MAWRRFREDRGSAVAEFPLVSILVVMVALATLQVALVVHVRNGLTDIAVQSAHHAAQWGNDESHGVSRARELTARRFSSLLDVDVSASTASGQVTVSITADLPLVGFLGPANGMTVSGHAVNEESLP